MSTDLVTEWLDQIKKGQATKKKWRDTFRVDDLDKYWEGYQQPNWWPQDTFITINLIFANVKTQLDGFKSVTPKFHVRPARTMIGSVMLAQQLDQQASLREAVLNYHVREQSFKREMQKVVLDAFINFGVAKTFYTPYHRDNPNKGRVIQGPTGPVTDENGYIEKEAVTELYKENFLVQRRNPDDMLFDPFADSLETITWIAERIEMTVEEVKSNKLFKNTEDIKAFEVRQEDKELEQERKIGNDMAKPLSGGNSSLPGDVTNKKREIVYVWEIYDLKENRIICLAEGFNKELRNDPTPDGIEGHPYAFMWFVDRRNSPYPIPYIWHQLGPQDEYNITRNQIITHRKRFNRKYEVEEGAIDDTELSKLEEPFDGMVIKTKGGSGKNITAIEDPSLDQAVYFDVNMLRKDFMDVAGEVIPESEMAQIEKATVAQLVSNRQENRKRGVIGSVSDFLEQVARKLILLYENELTLPTLINIVGETGAEWKNLNPQSLFSGQGEFLYEVAADSLVPQTPEIERSTWVAFLQFVAMNPQISMSPTLLQKTARMFGVEDKVIIAELQAAAMRIIEQQKLQGGQPGQASMSGDMAKTLGMNQ